MDEWVLADFVVSELDRQKGILCLLKWQTISIQMQDWFFMMGPVLEDALGVLKLEKSCIGLWLFLEWSQKHQFIKDVDLNIGKFWS